MEGSTVLPSLVSNYNVVLKDQAVTLDASATYITHVPNS